jgi:hypothetical protein
MRAARLLAAAVAVSLVVSACESRHEGITDRQPGGRSLLYVRGSTLFRHDLPRGPSERVGTFPAPDVFAPSTGNVIAYVTDGAPGQKDFASAPKLHVLDLADRRDVSPGAGLTPMWDATGRRLAYLRPVTERKCDGEACRGLLEVHLWDRERDRLVLGAGRWSLLAWAGDRLLVGDAARPGVTWSVGPDERIALPITPSSVWDGTPDGSGVVVVKDGAIGLQPLAPDGRPDGRAEVLGRGRLAEGTWSGSKAVAVLIPLGEPTQAIVLDAGARTLAPIPGTEGATGRPLWAGDKSIVISRPARRGRLGAELCSLDTEGCRPLFSWRRGVVLLSSEFRGLG